MPIFEYKCAKCGKVTEFLESAAGRKKRECSHCGSGELKKLVSSFAGIVKNNPEHSGCSKCTSEKCPYSGG